MKQYFAAVIEDDSDYAQYLKECLVRYGTEKIQHRRAIVECRS